LDGDPHSIVEKDLAPHMKTLARTSAADVDTVDVADLEEVDEPQAPDEPHAPDAKRARLSTTHSKRVKIAPICRREFGRAEQRRAEQTRAQ
jgi:hypothetical protein